MHPMLEGIGGSSDESISDLQEVLGVEGHLWAQVARRIDPCSLNVLPVDVFPDDFVEFLLVWKKVPRGVQ